MIFACPSCSASHFKPDAEAKAGVTLTCRRCKARFRVTAAGAEALPPEEAAAAATKADTGTSDVAQAIAAEATHNDAPLFEGGSTDVMKVPQGIATGGLADALEPESAEADMIETIDAGEPIDDAAAPMAAAEDAPTPLAMDSENSTTAAGEGLGFGEVTAANEGPSLGDLSALSGASEPEPGPVEAAFDSAGSGLPTFAPQPVTEAIAEMPTVIEPQPDIAALERESAAQAKSVDSGSGVFEPVVPAEKPKKPKSNRPSAAAIYARHMARQFSNATPGRKAMMLSIPLAVLALAIILVALSGGPPPEHHQWVTSPASMWSGPAAQRGYAQIDTLIRGEDVVSLREVYGDYLLVRDTWGRVGFINRESLSDEKPPVTPESAFAGCRQAPIESDKEPCEMRARAMQDSCSNSCAADSRCLGRCQDRFSECIDGCKTRLTVPQAVAAAPEPDPTETPVAEENTDQAIDKVAAEKPIKTSKATKVPKTTKKTTTKKDSGKKRH